MRYFLEIAYKGTAYHGWQIQPNAHSIQQLMNEHLSLKLGEAVYCIGCGRTDTGVHASRFFLHFDAVQEIQPGFVHKMNSFLPKDIVVYHLYRADEEVHARFSALERTYTYRISQRKNPFLLDYAAFIFGALDVAAMNAGAQVLLEYQDFEALSKISEAQKHHLCTIYSAEWRQESDELIFTITANRFLRGMVRVVVGTLLQLGKSKLSVEGFRQILESKDRRKAAFAAPAEGLYLSEVKYPQGLLKLIE